MPLAPPIGGSRRITAASVISRDSTHLLSLTRTDELIACFSLKPTSHSENSQTNIPNRKSTHSSAARAVTTAADSSAESVSFNKIDEQGGCQYG